MAVYFVDSVNGSQENDGLSEARAFKNFEKINQVTFSAGDKILLCRGSVFTDHLVLRGSGEEYNPIEVTAYGRGLTRPAIKTEDGNKSAVLIAGGYITVSGIEVTNEKERIGIQVFGEIYGAIKGVTITDCYIHEVWTKNELGPRYLKPQCSWMHEFGGITVETNGEEPTWYEDLVISHNKIENVNRTGIWLGGKWNNRFKNTMSWMKNPAPSMDDPWYPHKNVSISYNVVDHAHGDGIVAIGCQDAMLEYNRVYYANCSSRMGNSNVALWTMNSNDAIVQYNEVAYTGRKYGGDGEAFDIDQSNIRNIYQYNYSHDNDGGFILICNGCNDDDSLCDNIVRNNLSVNDAAREDDAIFNFSGPMKNFSILNNTIYKNDKKRFRLVLSTDYMAIGSPREMLFANNVFYAADNNNFNDFYCCADFRFENNITHNMDLLPQKDSITEDSNLNRNPVVLADSESPYTVLAAKNFGPAWYSPMLRFGKHYNDCATKDLYGQNTEGKVYVGAIYNEDLDPNNRK